MIKILITSVGSLVGQNILDVLESRRSYVKVIGTNSVAENHRNFRCDTVYLVPPTADLKFEEAFDKIIHHENPDIIFAGRDLDVIFLTKYKETHPETNVKIPGGSSEIASIIFDKYANFQFAMENNLPFADTFLYKDKSDTEGLNDFILKHGLPLIVKPRLGFGSLNVFFLTNQEQIDLIIENEEETLLQEYLSQDKNLNKYLKEYNRGLPLFFQIPDFEHYVSHGIISPEGKLIALLSTRHKLVGGKAESTILHESDLISEMAKKYIEKLISFGWTGSINLQYKQDINGNWKVFEINSRMVGASSSRLLLGFDEIALLINSFLPKMDFPILSTKYYKKGIVLKSLTDFYIETEDVEELTRNNKWQKK